MYKIGEWYLDEQRNKLLSDFAEADLAPLSAEVLVYLVKHAGRVITFDELLGEFWSGKVTEQSTIHKRINLIRNALGDSSKAANHIQTIPKRGYRVVAEVSQVVDAVHTQGTTTNTWVGQAGGNLKNYAEPGVSGSPC